MNRTILLLPLALLLMACATSAVPPRERTLEVRGPFTHPSGMVFPEKIGTLQRSDITQFPTTRDNYGVSYIRPSGSAVVSVYVYPTEGQALEEHFAMVVNDVATAHRVAPLQQSESVVVQGSNEIRGRSAAWQYSQQMGATVIPVRSRAFLFQREPWFVKVRVTNAVDVDDAVRVEVQQMLAGLRMP
jgi:hypothetical protein